MHNSYVWVVMVVAVMMTALTACEKEQGGAYDGAPGMHTGRPRLSMYPEFQAAPSRVSTQSQPMQQAAIPANTGTLPPLPPLAGTHTGPGLHVVDFRTGSGPLVGGRGGVKNMNPEGWHPVKQLIYGGAHPQYDAPEPVTFSPRDRMELLVREHPEFSGSVSVGQNGKVRIPNTDDLVMAQGKTQVQLQQSIKEVLAGYIKGEPDVEIRINFVLGGYYYLFGEVSNSGRFPMGLDQIRLSEAIFRSNSTLFTATADESREARLLDESVLSPRQRFQISRYANLTQVSVITPHRSRPTRKVYNVKQALFQGMTGEDPLIMPGQIIFVPSTIDRRIIEFSDRFVAPIAALRQMDDEVDEVYQRTTGNGFDGLNGK